MPHECQSECASSNAVRRSKGKSKIKKKLPLSERDLSRHHQPSDRSLDQFQLNSIGNTIVGTTISYNYYYYITMGSSLHFQFIILLLISIIIIDCGIKHSPPQSLEIPALRGDQIVLSPQMESCIRLNDRLLIIAFINILLPDQLLYDSPFNWLYWSD